MFSAGCFFSSIVLRKCIYVVDKSRGRHYSHPCSVMPLAYIPVRSPLSLGALSKYNYDSKKNCTENILPFRASQHRRLRILCIGLEGEMCFTRQNMPFGIFWAPLRHAMRVWCRGPGVLMCIAHQNAPAKRPPDVPPVPVSTWFERQICEIYRAY